MTDLLSQEEIDALLRNADMAGSGEPAPGPEPTKAPGPELTPSAPLPQGPD
ncbi:hypothetical protein HYY75_01955, partial [bacterium]|nr:hypothetical protein [bacterium]